METNLAECIPLLFPDFIGVGCLYRLRLVCSGTRREVDEDAIIPKVVARVLRLRRPVYASHMHRRMQNGRCRECGVHTTKTYVTLASGATKVFACCAPCQRNDYRRTVRVYRPRFEYCAPDVHDQTIRCLHIVCAHAGRYTLISKEFVLRVTHLLRSHVASPGGQFNLDVAYAERHVAKACGAHWDNMARTWYVPEGFSITPFLHSSCTNDACLHKLLLDRIARMKREYVLVAVL